MSSVESVGRTIFETKAQLDIASVQESGTTLAAQAVQLQEFGSDSPQIAQSAAYLDEAAVHAETAAGLLQEAGGRFTEYVAAITLGAAGVGEDGEYVHSPQVAGVTLTHVSDESPYLSRLESEPGRTLVDGLKRLRTLAQEAFAQQGLLNQNFGIGDERIPMLSLWDRRDDSVGTRHHFLITEDLIAAVERATALKGSELTETELLPICLAADDGSVEPDFTADAMNAVNASFYATEMAFTEESGLANMFVDNAFINRALGVAMARAGRRGQPLRAKELSSGSHTGRWRYVGEGALSAGTKQVHATVTDFVVPPINPAAESAHVTLAAEEYSLFDDMPPLPKDQRFNVMLITYGADSVCQPEDAQFIQIGDQWYQQKYRAKVAEWSPRRAELLEALRQRKPLPNAQATDYDGIVFESSMIPIDIKTHKYAKYLLDAGSTSYAFPGGLIKRILNAFENQLTDNGIFINGEVCSFNEDTARRKTSGILVSGVAGMYKVEDYSIAKTILEQEYGLVVEIQDLPDFVAHYTPGWEKHASQHPGRWRDEIKSGQMTGVMIVRRGRSS